jgi:hypothetical protein
LVVDLRQSMPYTRIPGTRAYGAPVCANGPSATKLKIDYNILSLCIIINCLLFHHGTYKIALLFASRNQ